MTFTLSLIASACGLALLAWIRWGRRDPVIGPWESVKVTASEPTITVPANVPHVFGAVVRLKPNDNDAVRVKMGTAGFNPDEHKAANPGHEIERTVNVERFDGRWGSNYELRTETIVTRHEVPKEQ